MAEPAKLQERSAELEGLVTEAASRLSVEALLDALCAIYDECSRLDNKNRLPAVQAFINRCACRRCARRRPGRTPCADGGRCYGPRREARLADEPLVRRVHSLRLSMNDFRVVKTLGRGAFGEVNLCASNFDSNYYAIKKLRKSEMLSRQEVRTRQGHQRHCRSVRRC